MNDRLCNTITPLFTRRDVLRLTGCGFGSIAFAGLACGSQSPGNLLARLPARCNPSGRRCRPGRSEFSFFACAEGRRTLICSTTSPS